MLLFAMVVRRSTHSQTNLPDELTHCELLCLNDVVSLELEIFETIPHTPYESSYMYFHLLR
jgi:hypothetical protein